MLNILQWLLIFKGNWLISDDMEYKLKIIARISNLDHIKSNHKIQDIFKNRQWKDDRNRLDKNKNDKK